MIICTAACADDRAVQTVDPAQGVELSYWADNASDAALKKWGLSQDNVRAHPCGATVSLRFDSIPSAKALKPFSTDRIVEYGDNGKIMASWRVPVDSTMAGVAGDWIYLNLQEPFPSGREFQGGELVQGFAITSGRTVGVLAIHRDGRIELRNEWLGHRALRPLPVGSAKTCPAAIRSEFENSDYLVCEAHRNFHEHLSDDVELRNFAWETPCT